MGNIFNRSPSSLTSLSKAKRDIALGLKRSPLFSWRYGNRNVDQLMLVPRDLRTADPSLSIELDMGQFGLAGATVFLNGGSPFKAQAPNLSWAKELHSFSWVRNLRAARTDRSQEQAMELTSEWLHNFRAQKDIAWEPEVAARRLISWLSHSNFLLYEADERAYVDMMSSIDDHMRYLSMTGMYARVGLPRLLSLIALMYAGLCVAEQEKFAEQHLKLISNELEKQILPDGGHISRDNSVLASILLDLLPLRQCFVTRNITPPEALTAAINRMLPMINYMRLGDGLMSRFNGAGTTLPDTLSTAMAYDDVNNEPLKEAPNSHYYRLERGNVIVIMDGGPPPHLDLTAKSHAGCLSFEMSSGTCPVIVNCGAAPPAFQTMSSNARATVSHSTLTINNRSSGGFIHDTKVKNSQSPSLLDGPAHVSTKYEADGNARKIIGSHDGYLSRFGITHHRLISLSNDGYSVIGEDWIEVDSGNPRGDQALGWPYAVHFHIHPDVVTSRASDGKSITLTLPDSQEWKFTAKGAVIHLEESTFYADFAGPCQSVQAVIRGNCVGSTSVAWMLAKVVKTQSSTPPKVPEWMAENVIPLDQAERGEAGGDEKSALDKFEKVSKFPGDVGNEGDAPPPLPAESADKKSAPDKDIGKRPGDSQNKAKRSRTKAKPDRELRKKEADNKPGKEVTTITDLVEDVDFTRNRNSGKPSARKDTDRAEIEDKRGGAARSDDKGVKKLEPPRGSEKADHSENKSDDRADDKGVAKDLSQRQPSTGKSRAHKYREERARLKAAQTLEGDDEQSKTEHDAAERDEKKRSEKLAESLTERLSSMQKNSVFDRSDSSSSLDSDESDEVDEASKRKPKKPGPWSKPENDDD